MDKISYIPLSEIKRVQKTIKDPHLLSATLSDIFRINILYMFMNAGSGHIGTSFSSVDVVTWLWMNEMKSPNDSDAKESDKYFSSKGHDAPALYALLMGLEKIPFDFIHKFRRLGGLPGHPDIETPYIITNTGSLGMGISKARGMAFTDRLGGKHGKIYVLTGDGELQEGQIWESLQPTANQKFSEITLIVDNNKIQSDAKVEDTSDLGTLEEKFKSFGWEVARCDGHDTKKLHEVFSKFKKVKDKPQVLIADTIKGKGVTFMEKISSDGFYKYHSGALSYDEYIKAKEELSAKINKSLKKADEDTIKFDEVNLPHKMELKNPERLVNAYSSELLEIAKTNKKLVALDADLVLDTGLISFKKNFPARYIECGIAEQDMVSMAGGLALSGMLPVVHSFACFLSTRPNEQIYNNSSEHTKIIYVGSLAGILPAAPGHSHQSVRDISLLGSIPGMTIIEPCNEEEAKLSIRWAVEENRESSYIRLVSIPCEIPYTLPHGYKLKKGYGVCLAEGYDVAILSYGPVMLAEAYKARESLREYGISVAVYNMPWLNYIDQSWLKRQMKPYKLIVTIDDHYTLLGLGSMFASVALQAGMNKKFISLGIENIPVCGKGDEVLEHHKVDSKSIVKEIQKLV